MSRLMSHPSSDVVGHHASHEVRVAISALMPLVNAMKRRLVVGLVFGGLAGVLVLFAAWHWWFKRSLELSFPDDSEVESVIAEVLEVDGVTRAVPPTTIPSSYVPRILDSLRPPIRNEYPAAWDDETIGRVTINTRDGRSIRVTFPFSGKNPLCFRLDGICCRRGGSYVPDIGLLHGVEHDRHAPECLFMANVIREIHEEQVTGKKSETLNEYFEQLERSAGKRPPRKQ